MENYIEVSENEPMAQNPLANFIRNKLPDQFESIIPNSRNYVIKGSPGIGSWAKIPWIGFLNRNISATFKEGYYIACIFKEDMTGFYLSLMFGVGNFRNFSQADLIRTSGDLREFISDSFEIKPHNRMKLRKRNSRSYIASRYEKADIYSIGYSIDNLPSEDELKRNLFLLLEIYELIFKEGYMNRTLEKNVKILNKYPNHDKSEVIVGDSKERLFSDDFQKTFDDIKHGRDDLNWSNEEKNEKLADSISDLHKTVEHHEGPIPIFTSGSAELGSKSVEKDSLSPEKSAGSSYKSSKNITSEKYTHENDPFISIRNHDEIKIHEIDSKPNKYYNFKRHSNKYKKLAELLSDENIEKLDEISYLDEDEFEIIIENIINAHRKVLNRLTDKNHIEFEKLDILEKMFLFSKSFVKTHYKSNGDDLGYYRFNEIYIDEREPTVYKKIRTIIHELSHFLFSEILEQVLSEILDTDKTDILEAYVFYTLMNVNDFNLMDEYCACTVEGRFVPIGHQDYTSFKNSLNKEHIYSNEDISVYGNTFARYIISIMESFIDESLIQEIRNAGLNVDYPHNDIGFETDEYLEWDDFRDTVELILKDRADYNKFEAETIVEYSLQIRKNNK